MIRMNLTVILGLVLFVNQLFSEDTLIINLINEPKFDFFEFNDFNERYVETDRDSITSIDILSGQILDEKKSDIYLLAFLNSISCDYACPTDYQFSRKNYGMQFKILASNIDCDTLEIIDNAIVESDSIKVGIFALYTPDFAVKNDLPEGIDFNPDVFRTAYRQAKVLAISCDYVLMLSNLGKFIDHDIVNNIPVDVVVSFDYQKKENGYLANKRTRFYSIVSGNKKFGRLEFRLRNGRSDFVWQEINY